MLWSEIILMGTVLRFTLPCLSACPGFQTSSSSVFQGAVEAGIAAGYRHIDTAYMYRNEVEIGRALRAKMQQGVIRRQDVYVVSKVRR